MEAYIAEYLEYLRTKKHRSANTLAAYKQDLLRFALFLQNSGICQLDKITETSCSLFLLALEGEGKSPASVQRKLTALRSFFDFLIRRGYMKEDPTELLPSIHLAERECIPLSAEDQKKLLAQPDRASGKGKRDYALLLLLACAGLQPSELVSLRLPDLFLKNGLLTARSESRERNIRLTPETVAALEDYLSLRHAEAAEVFVSRSGEAMSRQAVWKLVRGYGERAGLPGLNPQQLRKQ